MVRCLQWRTLPTLYHWHGQWWKRFCLKYFAFPLFKRNSRRPLMVKKALMWILFINVSYGKQLLCAMKMYETHFLFYLTYFFFFAAIEKNLRLPTSCWQAEVQTCLQRASAWPQFPLIQWWLSLRGQNGWSTRIMLLVWWKISTLSCKYLHWLTLFWPRLTWTWISSEISTQHFFSAWIACVTQPWS